LPPGRIFHNPSDTILPRPGCAGARRDSLRLEECRAQGSGPRIRFGVTVALCYTMLRGACYELEGRSAMATGQAAGVCAALAAKQGKSPREVPARAVQEALLAQGADLGEQVLLRREKP
jgi:hypothetical protein